VVTAGVLERALELPVVVTAGVLGQWRDERRLT
jgi:hypothetical protein